MEDIDKTVMELLVRANTNRDMAACHLWFMIYGSW